MGSINNFDIQFLKSNFGLTAFVETGTWKGYAVEQARKHNFEKIYSIELHKDFWEKANLRFLSMPNITILNGTSIEILPTILPLIETDRTLWWLDAHLQDCYGLAKEITERFPLESELQLITSSRNIEHDVFLIDDLRIYEDGNFKRGKCPDSHKSSKSGIDFIFTALGKTHQISRDYADEGYVTCFPLLGL